MEEGQTNRFRSSVEEEVSVYIDADLDQFRTPNSTAREIGTEKGRSFVTINNKTVFQVYGEIAMRFEMAYRDSNEHHIVLVDDAGRNLTIPTDVFAQDLEEERINILDAE